MNNKSNILIVCGLLFLAGISLIFYGITYNNSAIVQLENALANTFETSKNYTGYFCMVIGSILSSLSIYIYFKNKE